MTKAQAVVLTALVLVFSVGCASAGAVMADAEVLRGEVARARANGAMECAPVHLATAEAHLDFVSGELSQGAAGPAARHLKEAKTVTNTLTTRTRECAKHKLALVDEAPPRVVVTINDTDGDGDGVPDRLDKCPNQPEDKDGFQDDDGCPDLDNDDDGIVDARDKCPNQAGPLSGDGCPAIPDADQDGVPDSVDKCPNQPEDKDGFQDEDGCPDPDNDGDGVTDLADKCPNDPGPVQSLGCPVTDKDGDGIQDPQDKCPDEPEDKDGFQDDDGCPDLDNDADGVPDAKDECPNEAGVKEERGCPRKYELVVVKKDRIELRQQIRFKSRSAKLVGKESLAVIEQVAQAMKDNPRIKKLRIEGHTDSVGDDAKNLKLSQDRANAVMATIVKNGVNPGRLEAVGFGETKPIASNSSAAGRTENRRTEFNILEQ